MKSAKLVITINYADIGLRRLGKITTQFKIHNTKDNTKLALNLFYKAISVYTQVGEISGNRNLPKVVTLLFICIVYLHTLTPTHIAATKYN